MYWWRSETQEVKELKKKEKKRSKGIEMKTTLNFCFSVLGKQSWHLSEYLSTLSLWLIIFGSISITIMPTLYSIRVNMYIFIYMSHACTLYVSYL